MMRLIALTITVTTFISATVCIFKRGLDVLLCAPPRLPQECHVTPLSMPVNWSAVESRSHIHKGQAKDGCEEAKRQFTSLMVHLRPMTKIVSIYLVYGPKVNELYMSCTYTVAFFHQ